MLVLTPISLGEAQAFVEAHHRHHGRVTGHKFSVAVSDDCDRVVGVAIVGRPVARHLDDGWTVEVNRLCVIEGHKNAASKLLGATWRAARALGYKKAITYTLSTGETGASLRGAGWRCIGEVGGGSWSCKSRSRVDKHPLQRKLRWETGDE